MEIDLKLDVCVLKKFFLRNLYLLNFYGLNFFSLTLYFNCYLRIFFKLYNIIFLHLKGFYKQRVLGDFVLIDKV
jgi:hypothetical protein